MTLRSISIPIPIALSLALLACSSGSRTAQPPPPPPVEVPDAGAAAGSTDAAIAWCIDDRDCKPGNKPCMDRCYKYNHPRGPEHDQCDRYCRQDYCARVPCASLRR